MYCASLIILYCDQQCTIISQIPGQHGSSINIQSVYTATTQTDFIIIVATKLYIFFLPQQAEVAQGVPGRLRPRIFLTLDTTRVVGRQPYAPAAFNPRDIPGTHF